MRTGWGLSAIPMMMMMMACQMRMTSSARIHRYLWKSIPPVVQKARLTTMAMEYVMLRRCHQTPLFVRVQTTALRIPILINPTAMETGPVTHAIAVLQSRATSATSMRMD